MPKNSSNNDLGIGKMLGELSVAAPLVVAQRMQQMALAGVSPSDADYAEIYRMGSEKVLAFSESWFAMSMQSLLVSQQMGMALLQALWTPGSHGVLSAQMLDKMHSAGSDVIGKGLAPVHRKAVSNVRRLQKQNE